jgi:type IV pilus assembly protein PilQ
MWYLFIFPTPLLAQEKEDTRVLRIEQQLTNMADSISPGLRQTANLSVSNAPIQDFVRGLAETHSLNISIDPTLQDRISNNFTNAKVLDILLYLIREFNLDIRTTGSIITFYRPVIVIEPVLPLPAKQLKLRYDTSTDLFTADLQGDSLSSFAKQATQLTKKNIVLAPGVRERLINGYIESMPLSAALDKVAYANNLKLIATKDNAFVLQAADVQENAVANRSQQTNASQQYTNDFSQSKGKHNIGVQTIGDVQYIDLDASDVPITELIKEVSAQLGINYVLFSEIQGNTTVNVKKISYPDFLNFLLQGTSHTYKVLEGIYTIGNRKLEGFRSTKLIRMQYRPVVKLDEVIPAELKVGVEIKLFPELNSIILSGGPPQIAEIAEFLKAIDQTVLNVLIEVIVVEVRKGHNVRTGVSAGLADSLVTTGGQIFPGLDFTLNAKSVNDVLSRINTKGLINLGRVTPNFYVTLQAMEQNNFLDIKSTPKLSTLNGHEANLTIGQTVFYLEQQQNITGGVTPITSITQQFKQVSADLNIKINPMVSGDDHITLGINAEFSDFIDPIIKGAPPGNATRRFTSMIRVKNEEMIVLGGLEEARKATTGSGFPILSRIPIIKYLFSATTRTRSDNRLIIFIRPTIVY